MYGGLQALQAAIVLQMTTQDADYTLLDLWQCAQAHVLCIDDIQKQSI